MVVLSVIVVSVPRCESPVWHLYVFLGHPMYWENWVKTVFLLKTQPGCSTSITLHSILPEPKVIYCPLSNLIDWPRLMQTNQFQNQVGSCSGMMHRSLPPIWLQVEEQNLWLFSFDHYFGAASISLVLFKVPNLQGMHILCILIITSPCNFITVLLLLCFWIWVLPLADWLYCLVQWFMSQLGQPHIHSLNTLPSLQL